MDKIKIAILGMGNVASTLVKGIEFYKNSTEGLDALAARAGGGIQVAPGAHAWRSGRVRVDPLSIGAAGTDRPRLRERDQSGYGFF